MFDRDMQINGRHATYWKSLSQLPANAVEASKNFKIFENYIYAYMVAPIIGILNGKKGYISSNDASKDTAGMLTEVLIKNSSKLKYIYRLIVLADTSEGLSDEEKVNMAFREDSDPTVVAKGMKLYTEYFYGGLEILNETFVQNCTTDDDYIMKLYEFVNAFKAEQNIDTLELNVEELLK